MRKSFTTTLVLTGVCLLLLVWYLAYEKKIRPQAKETEEKAKQLVTLTQDQIQELEIERVTNAPPEGQAAPEGWKPEYQKVTLRKTGGDWHIGTPLQDAADNATIASMVSALTTTKQDRVIDEHPKDLAQFGLKEPLIRARAKKDASSPAQGVDIGSNTPVGYNSYVKTTGGDAVYRAPRSLRSAFDKPLKDLRNKSILAGVARGDVVEVEIQAGKENVILKKEENRDEWTLARDGIPADVGEWNKTFNAVLDVRATEFPDAGSPLKEFGLASPAARVYFLKKDKVKVGLALGRSKDKSGKEHTYAKRDDKDTIYEVDKDVLDKATRPAAAYRSLQLAKFNRFDVQRIRVEHGADSFELVKDGTKWTVPADPKLNVDGAKVDTLLTRLQDTKIDKYLGEKAPKLGAADRAVVVRLYEKKATPPPADSKNPAAAKPEDQEKVALTFGKPRNKSVVVERSDLAVPVTIKETDFRQLSIQKQDFAQAEKPAAPAQATPEKKDDKKPGEQKKS